MAEEKEAHIDEGTKLPLKLVALVVGAAVSAVLWLQATMLGMNSRLDALTREVEGIREVVAKGADDRWRRVDMRVWRELFKARNPTLDIPEVPNGEK